MLTDAALDLLLGSCCVGCGTAGRLLCRRCERELPDTARLSWPTPTPVGLRPPFATGEYDDTLRALVLGFKEHGLLGLRRPLATQLALAVATALATTRAPGPIVLVPVPSRPSSVRQRALDSTWAITAAAARLLREDRPDIRAVRLLRTRPGVMDQAGLDAVARGANLAGSMTCPAAGLHRLARRTPRVRVVLCDDVLTTGATAREAQRALTAVGLEVVAIATVAATRKRFSGTS